MTVKDLCNDLGIDWKDGEDYSGVFFVCSGDKYFPCRINQRGAIVPIHGRFLSMLTVLDLINNHVKYKLVEKAKPFLCKEGEYYKTVKFDNDKEPFVGIYKFTGDVFDWYCYHTGNMFPENSFLTMEQKKSIVNSIVNGQCIEVE